MRSARHNTNYLVSASDAMAGVIFVFIILIILMSFAFNEKMQVYKKITQYQEENKQIRDTLLDTISNELSQRNIHVDVDHKHGVIRLNETSLVFPAGQYKLSRQYKENLVQIAEVLNRLVPCYASNPPESSDCKDEHRGRIELIFIEGHTDNVPLGPRLRKIYNDNLELSTRRANYTYRVMVEEYSVLSEIKNESDYPLISVSGYGDNRPVPGHEHRSKVEDAANRRIDIRFIMSLPNFNQ